MNQRAAIYILSLFSLLNPDGLFGQLKADDLFSPLTTSVPMNQIDSTKRRDNIKFDPLKIFFNEVNVSYEHFNNSKWIKSPASDLTGIDSIIYKRKMEIVSSMNYIFGFIFPSDIEQAFQYKQDIHDYCINHLDDVGLSPFINWGGSFSFAFRRYRNSFHYEPQLLEKFVFYPKTYVNDKSENEDGVLRLQSGHANVLGIGYSIGWQKVYKGFVADLFFGVGGRLRLAKRKIYEEQNYMGPNVIFEDPKTENLSRLYPSLDLGIRLGFNL